MVGGAKRDDPRPLKSAMLDKYTPLFLLLAVNSKLR